LKKKPDKNITPLIEKIEDIKIVLIKLKLDILPMDFNLWELNEWIKIPAHKNIRDLKKAWITKWKKAANLDPKVIIKIINPNWLKVEKATIFLNQVLWLLKVFLKL